MESTTNQPAGTGVTALGVSYDTYLGVTWASVAVSGLALGSRLYSRYKGPRRVFWDDAFAIASWTLVLITGALWQWAARDMYYVIGVEAGFLGFKPDFYARLRRWLVVSLVVELFFYTSLVFVKLSFLFFFRRLGTGIDYYRYVWWPVAAFSLITYLVSVGDVDYMCLVGPNEYLITVCNSREHIGKTDKTLVANAVLDVLSDFLTMLLPLVLLWNVRIRLTKKLAVLGLFSLSLVTIAIAIVRVADINATRRPDGNEDVSFLWLWSVIEPTVAIVVSSLSAFPQLFKASPRSKRPEFTPSDTYRRMMSRIRSGKKRQGNSEDWFNITDGPYSMNTKSQATEEDDVMRALSPLRSTARVYSEQPPYATFIPNEGISHQLQYEVNSQRC